MGLGFKIKKRLSFLNFRYKKFGKRSIIYKPILISGKKYISIGDNVMIRNGARIEAIHTHNNVIYDCSIFIGNNTNIEQGFHCTSAGVLKIGNNCDILPYVLITNINHTYNQIDRNVNENDFEVKDTIISDNCFIGMNAKIFPGVHIGKNVIIGANSIVMNDVDDYCVVAGTPAKVIKKYDFEKKEWLKVKEGK